MYKLIVIFSIIFMFSGCARVHNGNYAKPLTSSAQKQTTNETTINDSIRVSGKFRSSYCSEYFGFIDFTFENTTNEWIYLKDVKIKFDDDIEKKIYIPFGKEMNTALEAIITLDSIRSANTEMLLGTVGLIGAIALQSNSKTTSNIGTSLFGGAIGSLSIAKLNDAILDVSNANIFPSSHLYSGNIIIPPGLFTKKWILLNSKNAKDMPFVTNIQIEYTKDENTTKTLDLHLRNNFSRYECKWQNSLIPINKRGRDY